MKRTFTPFLLTLLFITAFGRTSKACSCMPVSNHFCGTIQLDTTVKLIGHFKKIATYHYGFKALRLQNFHGTETRDTLMIWGDNGALCRIYDGWAVGDEMILALQACDTWGNTIYNPAYPPDLEEPDHYQVSVCGVYSLNITGGNVVGQITAPSMQSVPLSTFTGNNCALTLHVDQHTLAKALSIYPVPAGNRLTAELAGRHIVKAEVMDVRGSVLTSQNVNGVKAEITLDGFADGVYCLRLYTGQGMVTRRFQVAR